MRHTKILQGGEILWRRRGLSICAVTAAKKQFGLYRKADHSRANVRASKEISRTLGLSIANLIIFIKQKVTDTATKKAKEILSDEKNIEKAADLATKKIVETLNDKEKLEKAVNAVSKKAVDLLQDGKVVKKIANVSAKQATKVLNNEKVIKKFSQD